VKDDKVKTALPRNAASPPPVDAVRGQTKNEISTPPAPVRPRDEKFAARAGAIAPNSRDAAGSVGAPPVIRQTAADSATAAAKPDNKSAAPLAAAPLPVAVPVYRWYSIEAGTTDDPSLAEQLQAAYAKQGMQVAVENYWDEKFGRKRYRVLIGMFKTKEGAENKAGQLGDKLVPGYRVVGVE
jgi:hypothetical protein